MLFKFGLLTGAALTIGLITLALVSSARESETATVGEGGQGANGSLTSEATVDNSAPGSSKDEVGVTTGSTLESFFIIWSEYQDQTLSVSLEVGPDSLSSCQLELQSAGDSRRETTAQIVSSGQQRACIGHFDNLPAIEQPAGLTVKGVGSADSPICQFELQALTPTTEGFDLVWATTSLGCVGNLSN